MGIGSDAVTMTSQSLILGSVEVKGNAGNSVPKVFIGRGNIESSRFPSMMVLNNWKLLLFQFPPSHKVFILVLLGNY